MINIETIRDCIKNNKFIYYRHALIEMATEEFGRIYDEDIENAVLTGEIIKQYPDDQPYPSVLIAGSSAGNNPFHIVCAYNKAEDLVLVITAYRPDPDLWIDPKTRRQ